MEGAGAWCCGEPLPLLAFTVDLLRTRLGFAQISEESSGKINVGPLGRDGGHLP